MGLSELSNVESSALAIKNRFHRVVGKKVLRSGTMEVLDTVLSKEKPLVSAHKVVPSYTPKPDFSSNSSTILSSVTPVEFSYKNIFGLNYDGATVAENFKKINSPFKKGFAQKAFTVLDDSGDVLSKGKYIKDTLWDVNTKPVKRLMLEPSKLESKDWAVGLFRLFGLSMMGMGIAKTTKKIYEHEKRQQNDGFQTRSETIKDTSVGCCKKILKSIASWELAGITYAFGRAFFGGLSPLRYTTSMGMLGGVVSAAVLGTVFSRSMDKLFPDISWEA